MNRDFDYSQKILVAVEYAERPRPLLDMPPTHAVFRRLTMPQVMQAFDETHGLVARLFGAGKFQRVLDEHTGYWEGRVAAGKDCFVHYAIGPKAAIDAAFTRLRELGGWVLCGVYTVEPQSSAYPFGFPISPVPSHAHLDEVRSYGKDSVFWFNFFPAQPYLFEKTFRTWALFQVFEGREGGECNQLVVVDGQDRLQVAGVDEFVQINLNRFTSLLGFFNSAHDAGKHSFTNDPDYRWSGMLLRKL
jgi:hypothetical protein